MSPAKPEITWAKKYWDWLSMPKNRLVFWLAFLGKLETKEKFQRFGVFQDNSCLICGDHYESHQHLCFGPFGCKYQECMRRIQDWLGMNNPWSLVIVVNRNTNKSKASRFQRGVFLVALEAVSVFWKLRNDS